MEGEASPVIQGCYAKPHRFVFKFLVRFPYFDGKFTLICTKFAVSLNCIAVAVAVAVAVASPRPVFLYLFVLCLFLALCNMFLAEDK